MEHIAFPMMYYGGDYNPDQWTEDVWAEDMRLFGLAHINIATLPVFSWAKLQPSEDEYDFSWLDAIIERLTNAGVDICLATSTAAQPAWMSLRYPEVLPVGSNGIGRTHGGRVNFCPNSPVYRDFAAKLTRKMAERYKNHPGLAIWHIANEYGSYCYCEKCAAAFREWLKARYGTICELNRAWNMSFWGHTVYSWEEIVPPSETNGDTWCFQGMAIDYMRFMSDSSLGCYLNELAVIREITPDIPITTNLMGTFKPLDYFKWAEHMDVVSWDNYPSATTTPGETSLRHDLMRGLKGGQPFMLMEQTPSQQNWQAYCSLKRPGVMRLWSYQAVAHGADTVMFFQLRRSRGACEKYHGAVISHAGHENTRVFRECAELGLELASLGQGIIGAGTESRVAIIFDWENWWAVEASSGPSRDLKYVPQVERFYKAFHAMNIPVDFVKPGDNLDGYSLVIAPVMYMVQDGMADRLKEYVAGGGNFVTTFFSGIVDRNDLVTLGGYPGELRDLLGVWVEEIDSLFPHIKNSISVEEGILPDSSLKGSYECGFLCDILHLEGAEALARYGSDFYAGYPALTVNGYGKGKAYYVATHGEDRFIGDLVGHLCRVHGISAVMSAPEGVEITRRTNPDGKAFTFVLNHNAEGVRIPLTDTGKIWFDLLSPDRVAGTGDGKVHGDLELNGYGVSILVENR